MAVSCMNCGTTAGTNSAGYGPNHWIIVRNWIGGIKGYFCSSRCKDEYNSRNS